ncbi:hypothetical protein L210DRAFT_212191 [Boletus edulis BED1]|uniref:Uncharacterized protein n=1 Tax=Boletus edulis BED1 TaxID=1328754 RepID=A0AAD4BZR0_BOLED|nr:hypothetical protein L210DRAFT_212191 [Boletus edulis BED1]
MIRMPSAVSNRTCDLAARTQSCKSGVALIISADSAVLSLLLSLPFLLFRVKFQNISDLLHFNHTGTTTGFSGMQLPQVTQCTLYRSALSCHCRMEHQQFCNVPSNLQHLRKNGIGKWDTRLTRNTNS